MISVSTLSPYTSLFSFLVGLPTLIGTYYQSWKTRHEAKQAREGLSYSENCLEFLLEDGTTINLVPLETLHTLPKPGDIVFLPGNGHAGSDPIHHAAYKICRIEHIYVRVENRQAHLGQARLAKTVAHVDRVSDAA
jgi:hypothetical protein